MRSMRKSIYSGNIEEFREKYGDIRIVPDWLRSSRQSMPANQFKQLVRTMHEWMLQRYSDNALAEKVLQLLLDVDPSGDFERRTQLSRTVQRAEKDAQRAREDQDRKTQQSEELQRLMDARRSELLDLVRLHLSTDFLSADYYF